MCVCVCVCVCVGDHQPLATLVNLAEKGGSIKLNVSLTEHVLPQTCIHVHVVKRGWSLRVRMESEECYHDKLFIVTKRLVTETRVRETDSERITAAKSI